MQIGQQANHQKTLIPVNYKAFNRMADAVNILRKLDFDPRDFMASYDAGGVHVRLRGQTDDTVEDERHFKVVSNVENANVAAVDIHGGTAFGEIHGTKFSMPLNGSLPTYDDIATVGVASNGYIYGVVTTVLNTVTNVTAQWFSSTKPYYSLGSMYVPLAKVGILANTNTVEVEEEWHGGDIPYNWGTVDSAADSTATTNSLEWCNDWSQIWKFNNTTYAKDKTVLVKNNQSVEYLVTNTNAINCVNAPSNWGSWDCVSVSLSNHHHHVEWADRAANADYADTAGYTSYAGSAGWAWYADHANWANWATWVTYINNHYHSELLGLNVDDHNELYWLMGSNYTRNYGSSIGSSTNVEAINLATHILMGNWACEEFFEADSYHVDGIQVVGPQLEDIADFADVSGADSDGTCRTKVNEILATLRTHGLIDTES